MGKACVRFKRLDDIALDVVGKEIARVPAKACFAHHESMWKLMGGKRRK